MESSSDKGKRLIEGRLQVKIPSQNILGLGIRINLNGDNSINVTFCNNPKANSEHGLSNWISARHASAYPIGFIWFLVSLAP